MKFKVICAWCGKFLGLKEGNLAISGTYILSVDVCVHPRLTF